MHRNVCNKCSGICTLVTGALILVNAFIWPRWLEVDGWVAFFGVLLVIFGFVKLVVPNKCPSCNILMTGMKPASKGKK